MGKVEGGVDELYTGLFGFRDIVLWFLTHRCTCWCYMAVKDTGGRFMF